jgi:hypothetical protein
MRCRSLPEMRTELSALKGGARRPRLFSVMVLVTNHHAESDADMHLRDSLTNTWDHIQAYLFPWLIEELGPLTEMHEQVITVLEVARVDDFVQTRFGGPGRPEKDRKALARAFTAKPCSACR